MNERGLLIGAAGGIGIAMLMRALLGKKGKGSMPGVTMGTGPMAEAAQRAFMPEAIQPGNVSKPQMLLPKGLRPEVKQARVKAPT